MRTSESSKNRDLKSQHGGALIRSFISILCVIILVFAVYSAFGIAFRFYDIRNNIVFALKGASLESDQELRKKVYGYAIRAGIKCEERDILVERSGNSVRAEVPFEYRLGVPLGELRSISIPLILRASGERTF
jgi:hypothetical protein